MKVSVFGLGYVGSVSAASFAADGHTVVGVDVNADKVASLNEGRSPIVEKGLDELIRDSGGERVAAGDDQHRPRRWTRPTCRCSASARRAGRTAAWTCRISSASASRSAKRCKSKADYHVVVVRSTVLPGTTHDAGHPDPRESLRQEVRDAASASPSTPSSSARERRFTTSAIRR